MTMLVGWTSRGHTLHDHKSWYPFVKFRGSILCFIFIGKFAFEHTPPKCNMERENDSFQKESAFEGADFQVSHVELQWNTWRIIPVSKWLVTNLNGHLERVPKLGDLRTPCFLTTYKSWDDNSLPMMLKPWKQLLQLPPSRGGLGLAAFSEEGHSCSGLRTVCDGSAPKI